MSNGRGAGLERTKSIYTVNALLNIDRLDAKVSFNACTEADRRGFSRLGSAILIKKSWYQERRDYRNMRLAWRRSLGPAIEVIDFDRDFPFVRLRVPTVPGRANLFQRKRPFAL